MITLKQIEALYWVHRLGSMSSAAEKLHTSQSAITKRIADIEQSFAVSLVECSHRNAVLTAKGLEIYQLGKELLKQRDQITAALAKTGTATGRYRIGTTELTAISWLPEFSDRFRTAFPGLTLEAEVSESARLRAKVIDGGIDFAVLDGSFQDLRLASVALFSVELAWMCRPGTVESDRTYELGDLARFPLLSPGPASDLALIYDRLFASQNLPQKATVTAPSVAALSALTQAGYGICCLPVDVCAYELRTKALQRIVASQSLTIDFVGMFRHDCVLGVAHAVANLAQCCAPITKRPE